MLSLLWSLFPSIIGPRLRVFIISLKNLWRAEVVFRGITGSWAMIYASQARCVLGPRNNCYEPGLAGYWLKTHPTDCE